MKILNPLNHSLKILVMAGCMYLSHVSYAEIWQLPDISTSSQYTTEPHFFYVGKGAQWRSAKFTANYSTEYYTTLVVKYDDKLIYNTTLNGSGILSFDIPESPSGFHRLDFILQQYSPPIKRDTNTNNFCNEEIDQVTYVTNSQIEYSSERSIFRIQDLPDALVNPQLVRAQPFIGLLEYDQNNKFEAAMLARLATSASSVTPIAWYEMNVPEQKNQLPNFILKIIHSATPLPNGATAHLGTDNAQEIRTLTIRYHRNEELLAAVNGLTNPVYLRQIATSDASFPVSLSPPRWAQLKQINTLADLGFSDFRLGQGSKSLFLDFPSVWQPTDILQGQLALRVQSGLIEGSNITTWIDNGLAGSMKLADLASDPVNRQFNFFAKSISNSNTFDFRIESSIIANSQCLPTANGSIWIDTQRSTVNLPHKLKNGVAALSMALATTPNIAIDHQDGSLGMAIIATQVAKKMLLSNGPVPLNIVDYSSNKDRVLNIQVNKKMYDQQLSLHQDIIYQPTAGHGYIVSYDKKRFSILTDSTEGAQNFINSWGKIQHNIPNNVTKLLVSENGNLYTLQKLIVGTQKTPLVQQSSFIIVILAISLLMLIAIIFWFWRNRKHAKSNEND